MKRLFAVLSLLGIAGWAHAGNSSLTVSSGTFLAIDGFTTAGSQFRQAVVIADPSVVANTASVDPTTGLTVHLASSSAVGIGSLSAGTAEIGNVKNSGTFAVQSSQSGAYIVTQSTVGAIPLVGGAAVTTANPLPVQSTGTVNVNIVGGAAAGGTSSNFNSAMPSAGTAIGGKGVAGNMGEFQLDASSNVKVSIATTSVASARMDSSSDVYVLDQATVTAAAPSYSAGTTNSLSMTTAGALRINVDQIAGSNIATGSGVNGSAVQRVTVATDQVPFGINETTQPVNAVGTAIVFVSTFANVAASQTDQVLVSTISTTAKICVHQLASVAGGTATNLTFNTKPTGSGTAITALFANGANGGEVLPWSPIPWFCTNVNASLSVTTGAGSTTGIHLVYGQE